MTREQAERLRQKKRRQRLRRKRIKAFTVLGLSLVLIGAVLFFAVKGALSFFGDKQPEGDTENPIGTSGVVETPEENGDTSGENSNITGENGGEEPAGPATQPTEEPTPQPTEEPANATPAGPKPEQTWATLLVNQWSHMPEGYVPEVRTISGTEKQFDVRAADALEQMLADARQAGCNMYLVSAYRTYDYQVGLFNRKVNEYKALGYDDETAKSEASQWVAIPGTSEHCIGLAADIVSSTWYNYNSDLTHDFEDTEHFDWLYEHCAEYGFILRYPKNREATTGITYEPWHYRYVGTDAAKYIMENNITLEEFCAE